MALSCYDMGWLRWVGCLKIQVSSQNTGLFCRALLQKRPIFLSILLIAATPYVTCLLTICNMTLCDVILHVTRLLIPCVFDVLICDVMLYVTRLLMICEMALPCYYICNTTLGYMWNGSSMLLYVTSLLSICDMALPCYYMWHDFWLDAFDFPICDVIICDATLDDMWKGFSMLLYVTWLLI